MSYIFDDLVCIFEKVRQNCPWDIVQTHESLSKYILEESYELVDAIESNNKDAIKEELADVLLQVIFHSQIASEQGDFNIYDVIDVLTKKIIERHPHVFGNEDAKEVLDNWEHKKAQKREYFLDGIPKSMPALLRCQKIQDRMAKANFDFENIKQVEEKITEEFQELQEAIDLKDIKAIEHEFGDILIAIVEYGRFLGINAELVLQKANDRMVKRFNYVEKSLKLKGKHLKDASFKDMEELWNESKQFDYK